MFNPFTSSFEEAEALSENDISPNSPIFQWFAAQEINKVRESIDTCDGFAVLAAIRKCVTRGLVAPEWLAYEFNRRFDSVLNCRAKSWDDPLAFGLPFKKGSNLNALRKKRNLMFAVWSEVNRKLVESESMPIDEYLFEIVGKKFYIGKTLTGEYYYAAKKYFKR